MKRLGLGISFQMVCRRVIYWEKLQGSWEFMDVSLESGAVGWGREYGGVIGECHVSREMGDHERIVLVNILFENFFDLKTKERSIEYLDSRLY